MTTLILICIGFWAIKAGIKAWQEAEVRKALPKCGLVSGRSTTKSGSCAAKA